MKVSYGNKFNFIQQFWYPQTTPFYFIIMNSKQFLSDSDSQEMFFDIFTTLGLVYVVCNWHKKCTPHRETEFIWVVNFQRSIYIMGKQELLSDEKSLSKHRNLHSLVQLKAQTVCDTSCNALFYWPVYLNKFDCLVEQYWHFFYDTFG